MAAKPKDAPAVINHPGNPEIIVTDEREIKVVAHINSGRRGILKTLQNMKKWATTNRMIHAQRMFKVQTIDAHTNPAIKIPTSMAEMRNPGRNSD